LRWGWRWGVFSDASSLFCARVLAVSAVASWVRWHATRQLAASELARQGDWPYDILLINLSGALLRLW